MNPRDDHGFDPDRAVPISDGTRDPRDILDPHDLSISPKRAAEILGASERHVARLITAGKLEGHHLGRLVRTTTRAVLEYRQRNVNLPEAR